MPEWLRQDVIAREQEFDEAFKRYDGLGQYAIQAESHGTSLQAAVASYAQLESLCRRDPLAGIDAIAQGLGWNPQALAHAYATRHGVIAPPQPAPISIPPDPAAVAAAAIAAFRQDPRNEFMPIVENSMRELLASGQAETLHDAYDLACVMSPHVTEIKMNRARPHPVALGMGTKPCS